MKPKGRRVEKNGVRKARSSGGPSRSSALTKTRLDVEQKRLVRTRLLHLRAQLRRALKAKKERLRLLAKTGRERRVALGLELRAHRARVLERLREHAKAKRAALKLELRRKKEDARAASDSRIARARAELKAEREHAVEARRVGREHRQAQVEHAKADEAGEFDRLLETKAVLGALGPLFERMQHELRPRLGATRAEAFLDYVLRHPEAMEGRLHPAAKVEIQRLRTEIAALEGASSKLRATRGPTPRAPRVAHTGPSDIARLGAMGAHGKRVERPEAKVKAPEITSTAAIAKRIRADIADAVKRHALPKAKYRVKTSVYAMGSSIDVEASRLPFPVLNPEAFFFEPGINLLHFDRERFRSRLTPAAQVVETTLNAIVDAYHWDKSDIASDYVHVRFHKDVKVVEDPEVEKQLEAEKRREALGEARVIGATPRVETREFVANAPALHAERPSGQRVNVLACQPSNRPAGQRAGMPSVRPNAHESDGRP
ncbi:hypothetical protein EON77_01270 [bacterium]|nr:MAG: hypothetical protein EON77_01270 [bacterium]